MDRRRRDRGGRIRRTLAYLAIVAAFAFTQYHDSLIIDRIERESLVRDYENCAASNDARRGIREFIEQLISGDGQVSESERRAIDLATERFAERECPPQPR